MNKDELGRLYPVFLVDYHDGRPVLFQKEKAILSRLLGPAIRIEHLGSTAEVGTYEQLKMRLAAENRHDRDAYTGKKAEYIRQITEKAKIDL